LVVLRCQPRLAPARPLAGANTRPPGRARCSALVGVIPTARILDPPIRGARPAQPSRAAATPGSARPTPRGRYGDSRCNATGVEASSPRVAYRRSSAHHIGRCPPRRAGSLFQVGPITSHWKGPLEWSASRRIRAVILTGQASFQSDLPRINSLSGHPVAAVRPLEAAAKRGQGLLPGPAPHPSQTNSKCSAVKRPLSSPVNRITAPGP
jgi:hypothetical protein